MKLFIFHFVLLYFQHEANCDNNLEKYRSDILRMLNHIPFDFGNKIDNSNVENVRFDYYLFQRKRSIRNVSVSDSFEAVNQKLPVKFLVHGWTEHNYVKWYQDITKAYLKKGNYNIIGVDWSKIGDASYVDASMQVEQAGKKIGDWIIRLHKRKKVPYKSFHLVSHSLGCQVSGFIGKRVFNVTGKKLGRITALDAASPIFELVYGEEGRLDKGDAEFVDAVHSDGGVLGFKSSIGTVDFFPNGGSAVQPGCSLLKPDVKYEDLFCSHARSHKYFLHSIYSNKTLATPCASWESYSNGDCVGNKTTIFGEYTNTRNTGNYYLNLEI